MVVVVVRPNANLAARCRIDHPLAYCTLEHCAVVEATSS